MQVVKNGRVRAVKPAMASQSHFVTRASPKDGYYSNRSFVIVHARCSLSWCAAQPRRIHMDHAI